MSLYNIFKDGMATLRETRTSSGDLITVRRALHENKIAIKDVHYTQFQDSDGNAFADNADDTATAMNEVFNGDNISSLPVYTLVSDASAALAVNQKYVLNVTIGLQNVHILAINKGA